MKTASSFSRREFLSLCAASAAGGVVAGRIAQAAEGGAPRRPPNFVVIFTDDQGYQDIGCFGSPDIRTPRLDQMAAEGMRFTDFYSAAPLCTPSRAALMTGCYAQRISLPHVLFPGSTIGISDKETTIADLLKTRSYARACVGKWHLGHLKPFLPTRHGFDYYFGIPYSNDMKPTPLMRNEETIEEPARQETLTERYTEEALKFIAANRDRPFFLYLPHTFPHVPLHVSGRFAGKSKRGLYGDVIEAIDWSTGQILDKLKELGLDDNTLVIFTSDNGPWLSKGKDGGSALPLRDGKGTTFEGGMREPCIMRWPGKIPAGRTCSEIASTIDVMPTLAGLAGAKIPADRIIDGKDIWPLMSGVAGAKTPHEAYFYSSGNELQAVRSGKWKLHLDRARPQAGRKKNAPAQGGQKTPAALYDLQADVGEKNNVAEQNPDVVNRLQALADAFRADIEKNRRPPGSARTAAAD